eukprot:TRINITY_DN20707_c0_g1_i1.p1 TRINITY_DN20707_c0_g1~~TRINITY_DN20707_c0_g1_i1.p1  ORF type:complete len:134 (+),score=24.53 TRINITY_DN20707_c0_g1_i1:60-461(+)
MCIRDRRRVHGDADTIAKFDKDFSQVCNHHLFSPLKPLANYAPIFRLIVVFTQALSVLLIFHKFELLIILSIFSLLLQGFIEYNPIIEEDLEKQSEIFLGFLRIVSVIGSLFVLLTSRQPSSSKTTRVKSKQD